MSLLKRVTRANGRAKPIVVLYDTCEDVDRARDAMRERGLYLSAYARVGARFRTVWVPSAHHELRQL